MAYQHQHYGAFSSGAAHSGVSSWEHGIVKSQRDAYKSQLDDLSTEHTHLRQKHNALKNEYHTYRAPRDPEFAHGLAIKENNNRDAAKRLRNQNIAYKRKKTMKSNRRKQKINKMSGGLLYSRSQKGKRSSGRKGRARA